MGKAAPPPTTRDERVTKQFRIDPDTWGEFTSSVGEKNASPALRRLIALYLQHEPTARRIARTADPSPDRRFVTQ